jgi:alcohol dehydrogenase class IV
MSYVSIASIPAALAGAGALVEIGALASAVAGAPARVAVVTDMGLMATGLPERLPPLLGARGHEAFIHVAPAGEPSTAAADDCAAVLRARDAGLVVAIGGGSALDLAKIAAAIAGAEAGSLAYQLCERPFPPAALPLIAIPTTAGTGSETTRTAILARPDKAKAWFWGEALKPRAVLIDPEASATLSPRLTAFTGVDALIHAFEAATNRNATRESDLFAHEALRLAMRALPRAVANGEDIEARAEMARAAMLAGIAIDNCGTAIAHTIGHAIGSLAPVPHGNACAIGLAASLRWSIAADDGRYGSAARAMGLTDAADLPSAFRDLCAAIGVDLALGRIPGAPDVATLAAQMARPENAAMRRSHLRDSDEAALTALAEAAIDGTEAPP